MIYKLDNKFSCDHTQTMYVTKKGTNHAIK